MRPRTSAPRGATSTPFSRERFIQHGDESASNLAGFAVDGIDQLDDDLRASRKCVARVGRRRRRRLGRWTFTCGAQLRSFRRRSRELELEAGVEAWVGAEQVPVLAKRGLEPRRRRAPGLERCRSPWLPHRLRGTSQRVPYRLRNIRQPSCRPSRPMCQHNAGTAVTIPTMTTTIS